MDTKHEDAIIQIADDIKRQAYSKAEATWKLTPNSEKKRPWPRCHDLTCNRTLTCKKVNCKGFDF